MNTQSKQKHTPGPWTLNGRFIGTADCDWWHPGNEKVVAEILKYGGTRPHEANALLIAAAPELLEACKFVLKYHNMRLDKSDDSELPFQLADAVQKAIEKAEGA